MPKRGVTIEEDFLEEDYTEDEYDIYSEDCMESMAEDDEISTSELGFMRGYME